VQALLEGMQHAQALSELPAAEGRALMEYASVFVDTLTLQQRALLICTASPYAPDVLQASVVLFEGEEGEAAGGEDGNLEVITFVKEEA
jgi:hypothetical protein